MTLGNCLTSFFAGFVIFSFIGFLSQELGVAVQDVATSGKFESFINTNGLRLKLISSEKYIPLIRNPIGTAC